MDIEPRAAGGSMCNRLLIAPVVGIARAWQAASAAAAHADRWAPRSSIAVESEDTGGNASSHAVHLLLSMKYSPHKDVRGACANASAGHNLNAVHK